MKKIVTYLLVLFIAITSSVHVLAVEKTQWTEFKDNDNIITTTTPQTLTQTKIEWSIDFTSGWDNLSDPIIVDDYLYFTTGTGAKLIKLDLNGNLILEKELASSLGYNVNITYSDGMIFVPLGDGRIQALNSDTLESLWISEAVSGAIQSKLTVYDGYLYFGSYLSDWSAGTSKGNFYALDTRDEDPSSTDEVKSFAWVHEASQVNGGYNWAKAVVYQDTLYFAGNDGQLVAHDLKNDTVYSIKEFGESICSALTLSGNDLYFTTKAGNIYCVQLIDTDTRIGTVTEGRVHTSSSASSTSSPTVYNGRIYVGGGRGFNQPGFISVLDANTLNILYTIDSVADVQAAPLVTTAYGKEVVAYFTANTNPGGLYALIDDTSSNTGTVNMIYEPTGDSANYCNSTPIADVYGNLYHFNDSGYLTKLSLTAMNSEIKDENTNVSVQGEFLAGTTLQVNRVEDQEIIHSILSTHQDLNKMTLYDLKMNLNGEPVQPGSVKVSLPIPEGYNPSLLALYYINDKNELISIDYLLENGKIVFAADGLSNYVIAELKEQTTVTPSQPQDDVVVETITPNTGDTTSNTTVYYVVGGLAVVGIIALVITRKKK